MSEVPVRVFIRIRPLLEHEEVHSSEECVQVVDEDQLVLGHDRSFRFDHVFPSNATQATVYDHCVLPLVTACLEGYNATVFAYGQTGSGKSFTMGSETPLGYEAEGDKGIIHRSLDALFEFISARPASTFTVYVSYIEIYKEELRDLLERSSLDEGGGERGIHIREDAHGNTVVLGGTDVCVKSADEALGWLEVGNGARVTGSTQMNQKSSRSHAIFTIHIEQRWSTDSSLLVSGDAPIIKSSSTLTDDSEECLSAKFHFVDLAGSERVSKTGNKGERFKESVHINSGLLALGNVISALGGSKRKFSHVPYRDSKITRLLKDSLGGNARTVMITCLSPAAVNFAESLNSLKYAKRARNIRNRPVVNRDAQSNKLHQMQEEIQSLRDELLRAQRSSKPVSVGTLMTVESSLNTEPLDVISRVSELEQELKSVREQCVIYQTSVMGVREQLTRLLFSGEGRCDVEQIQRLLEWIGSLKTVGETGPNEISTSGKHDNLSPLSAKAIHTIEMLRSELEQCQIDLQTDEELFAEKMEEMSDLQTNYSELVAEKDRLESMWLAAQESENVLRTELENVLGELSSLESEMLARDEIIALHRGLLQGGNESAPLIRHTDNKQGHTLKGHHEQGISHIKREIPTREEPEGIERISVSSDYSGFTANRSLLVGMVKTSSLEDFTEDVVLSSLRTLTQCLINSRSNDSDSQSLGKTWTRSQPTLLTNTGPTHNGRTSTGNVVLNGSKQVESEVRAKTAPNQKQEMEKLESLQIQSCDNELFRDRPTTPVEASTEEPHFSKMNQTGHRIGRQDECCEGVRRVWGVSGEGVTEMDILDESAVESIRQLTVAEEKLTLAHDELRNLNLKIKLKEELIRELVKTGQSTKHLNKAYLTKIQNLEREVLVVNRELNKTQSNLAKSTQSDISTDIKRAMDGQKKKLAITERKLATLQKKQKETQRLVQFGVGRERKVGDLESGIERLRNQQEILKRKLKNQADKKTKLENDLQKYQHRMKMLQSRSEQQSKVLKVKTEEAAIAQRKLRQVSAKRRSSHLPSSESPEAMWLDEEVGKILEQKQAMEALEKVLAERERVLADKESAMAERDALAVKQLQASQATARNIVHLSLQIDSIENSLKVKDDQVVSVGTGEGDARSSSQGRGDQRTQREIDNLKTERDKLVTKCQELQQKMDEESFLPTEDQRKLYELNEHLEILDAALDFKNSSIDSRQPGLHQLLQQDTTSVSDLKVKLEQLSSQDTCNLLVRYVEKVVHFQMLDRQHDQSLREMEVRMSEQSKVISKLERSLKQTTAAGERQVLTLQKEHERQVQLLVQQLADQDNVQPSTPHDSEMIQTLTDKVKQLEKDLYYYKKTSRDLKKKLRQEIADNHKKPNLIQSSESGELTRRPDVSSHAEEALNSGEGSGVDVRVGSEETRVVRKSKKQLRQLSSTEIAERRGQKVDKWTHPS